MKTYYLITIGKKQWTTEPQSLKEIKKELVKRKVSFNIYPARCVGDLTLSINGRNIAALFCNQKDQLDRLIELGYI